MAVRFQPRRKWSESLIKREALRLELLYQRQKYPSKATWMSNGYMKPATMCDTNTVLRDVMSGSNLKTETMKLRCIMSRRPQLWGGSALNFEIKFYQSCNILAEISRYMKGRTVILFMSKHNRRHCCGHSYQGQNSDAFRRSEDRKIIRAVFTYCTE
jgi:hypothetical protein